MYVDGGNTIQGLLPRGLIDEITLTVIPALYRTDGVAHGDVLVLPGRRPLKL